MTSITEFISHMKAMLYRNAIWAYRSPFRLTDVVIWPLVTLFMLTLFLSTVGGNTEFFSLLILSVVGWRAIYFVTFEMTSSFVEEHWHRALPNLLVAPVNVFEIAIGGAITGVLKAVIVLFLCFSVGYLIYDLTIIDPPAFLIAFLFLLLTGFSVGLVLFGFACYFDKRNVFTLSFVAPELVGLLSAPYYIAEDIFPDWLVSILNIFPSTHAFNLIKSIFGLAQVDYFMLITTSAVWLVLAFFISRFFYNLGRKKGKLVKVG